MKNFYNILIILAIVLFSSCEDDDKIMINAADFKPVELTGSEQGKYYELLENKANEVLTTFQWTEADYTYSAAVTYTLYVDYFGGNRGKTVEIISKNSSGEKQITYEEMNTLLSSLTYPTLVDTFKIKVRSSISNYVEDLYSDSIYFTAKIYDKKAPAYPFLYVTDGNSNWNWQKAYYLGNPSDDASQMYEGYAFIDGDNPKFQLAKGTDVKQIYGGTVTSLQKGGTAIQVKDKKGFYKLNADLANNTISVTKTEWGIIGDATSGGWGEDQNMKLDSTTGILTAELSLTAGEMKFRANDDWTLNYGDNGEDGVLEEGGANIKIKDDTTYRVTLDLTQAGIYKYTLEKINKKLSSYALYLEGDYQQNADSIISESRDGNFKSELYIPANAIFKFQDKQKDITYGEGAKEGTLEIDGGDIIVEKGNLYIVSVNLNNLSYSTKVAWGIIGDATPDGWEKDQDMTYDNSTGLWSVTITLTSGKIKFRKGDSWDINLGDSDNDGSLEQGGADIPVNAGTYEIKLDIKNGTYTMTKK